VVDSAWVQAIGVDPVPIMDQIIAKGINQYDAAMLVNNLIAVNLAQAPRHFAFTQPLPAASAACTPKFAREFRHQDWVDGESVVQASESADDKGFNWRFNAIADDLDQLNLDTTTLFGCLDTLRTALVQALQDVAAELNRIDADIAKLTPQVKPATPFNNQILSAPQYMGTRNLDGSLVTVWQHDQGVLVLPAVDTVGLTNTIAQHINTGPALVGFTADSAAFSSAVAKGMTVGQLISTYGQQQLTNGRTLGDVLSVLPPDQTFKDTTTLIDSVASWEQGYVRSTVGSVDAISAVTGVTSEGAPISVTAASFLASAVTSAPTNLSATLLASGLNATAVSAMTEKDLTSKLSAAGTTLTTIQAAQVIVAAKMAVAVTAHS
jgi:hypothetical protein